MPSFLTGLSFGVLGLRKRITNLSIENKKTFMIDTIKEVENRLSMITLDIYDSARRLEEFKKEFNEVSGKKRVAVERLRDVQTKYTFITRTTEHLQLKETEIVKDTDQFEKEKKELEEKIKQLKDEPSLDAEIDSLRYKVNTLAQGMAPYMKKLNTLESEKKSLAGTRNDLEQNLNTSANLISELQKDIPALQSEKVEREQHIQYIEDIQQKQNNAK